MTVAALPSTAHIQELRFKIMPRPYGPESILTRSRKQTARRSERWAGSILFAPMSLTDARTLTAFFHSLDGPVTPFSFPLKSAFARFAYSGATLTCPNTVAGSRQLALNCSSGPVELQPGTLLNVYYSDSQWQLVEVTRRAIVNAESNTAYVAPRLRFTGSTPTLETANPVARVRLAEEITSDFTMALTNGHGSIKIIEAV